jgi:hypothetical protein
MHHLNNLKASLLQLLRNYPIESYNNKGVPPSITMRKYVLEVEFLKKETVTIRKMGLAAMQGGAVGLDEVQKIINDAIREHFCLD